MRRLNVLINDAVNDDDKTLCERVQKGLRTHGYQPGPLSQQENGVYNFPTMLRDLVPVMARVTARNPKKAYFIEANAVSIANNTHRQCVF